jgi:hypothetical protein
MLSGRFRLKALQLLISFKHPADLESGAAASARLNTPEEN